MCRLGGKNGGGRRCDANPTEIQKQYDAARHRYSYNKRKMEESKPGSLEYNKYKERLVKAEIEKAEAKAHRDTERKIRAQERETDKTAQKIANQLATESELQKLREKLTGGNISFSEEAANAPIDHNGSSGGDAPPIPSAAPTAIDVPAGGSPAIAGHNGKIDDETRQSVAYRMSDNVLNTLRNRGMTIVRAENLEKRYYHRANSMPEVVNDLPEQEYGSHSVMKPRGALWMASGNNLQDGTSYSDWDAFCVEEKLDMPGNGRDSKLYEARFRPDAVILEVDESNVGLITHDGDISQMVRENSGEVDPEPNLIPGLGGQAHIDYETLRALGVDAIAVNGGRNREYFYGYDVDSLVVINGDSVSGWDERVSHDRSDVKYLAEVSESRNHFGSIDIQGNFHEYDDNL